MGCMPENKTYQGDGKMSEMFNKILEQEEDNRHGRFLTFTLEEEAFGIGIEYVTEIIGIQQITSMPDIPSYVKGIINLRGSVIPIIDMRLRFKKPPAEYNDRTCIVVIDINNLFVGLIVDTVTEVIRIADENIAPPPCLNKKNLNRYIQGIGKVGNDLKLLLDSQKLLDDDEILEISKIKN